MTIDNEGMLKRKRQKLRNNEYYDIQDDFDFLYRQAKRNMAFTDLISLIVDERNIKLAYRNIKKNKGSMTRGTDRLTIKKWENSNPDTYINYVKSRIMNYFPQKVRRVYIPKTDGKLRPLGIPTIGDRLIQQCIKQVLEPICEAKFHNHSYGFRPNRSTKHAIAKVYHCINIVKTYHVVDIDIKGFFDNVDHSKLLKQLWTLGVRDKNLLCVLSKMLKAEIEGEGVPTKGTPQGGILSPLLSNVVLNELDWWISDQWETFETRYTYSKTNGSDTKKYRALRKSSSLKEMFIVRYADDFKIMCKSKSDATKIFHACKQWLKDRLGLEVSPDKSNITDIRRKKTEFLGIEIGVQPAKKESRKRNASKKYVVRSHMTNKAKKKVLEQLRTRIKELKESPTVEMVFKYNATVLGIQNYYKIASHVNLDMNGIAYTLNKILRNRLSPIRTARGNPSTTYKRLYKNNYKLWYVAGKEMFPLGDISYQNTTLFAQSICNYTEEGRRHIHKQLSVKYNRKILNYLLNNPLRNGSVELNDNRISLYIAQYGKCGISGELLEIGNMEVHHRKPRNLGGTDEYKNLIFVSSNVHKLIHATTEIVIRKYLSILNLSEKALTKLNTLRSLVGNPIINITM